MTQESREGAAGDGIGPVAGRRPRVLIVGSASRDVIRRADGRASRIGGTVWFAGTTLAGLGIEVTVLTRLAEADRAIAEALAAAGIVVEALASPLTTEFHNIYGPGGRDDRRQEVGVLAPPIDAEAVARLTAGADVVYLGALHPDDVAAPALALLGHGTRLAMDVQGFTRHIRGRRVAAEVAPALAGLLARAWVVKASRHEARLITGEAADEAAAGSLLALAAGGEVLVTLGNEGALLATGDGLVRATAAAGAVADPTGAGDVFLASYLAARLKDERPREALDFAVAHAARRLNEGFRSAGGDESRINTGLGAADRTDRL